MINVKSQECSTLCNKHLIEKCHKVREGLTGGTIGAFPATLLAATSWSDGLSVGNMFSTAARDTRGHETRVGLTDGAHWTTDSATPDTWTCLAAVLTDGTQSETADSANSAGHVSAFSLKALLRATHGLFWRVDPRKLPCSLGDPWSPSPCPGLG